MTAKEYEKASLATHKVDLVRHFCRKVKHNADPVLQELDLSVILDPSTKIPKGSAFWRIKVQVSLVSFNKLISEENDAIFPTLAEIESGEWVQCFALSLLSVATKAYTRWHKDQTDAMRTTIKEAMELLQQSKFLI